MLIFKRPCFSSCLESILLLRHPWFFAHVNNKKREKNPTTTTKQAATTDLFATFKLFVLALDVLFQLSNLLLDLVDLLVVLLQAALFPQLAGLQLLNGLHPFLLHCHQGRLKHHSTMSLKGHRSHHCVTETVVCWFCACLSLWFVGPNGLWSTRAGWQTTASCHWNRCLLVSVFVGHDGLCPLLLHSHLSRLKHWNCHSFTSALCANTLLQRWPISCSLPATHSKPSPEVTHHLQSLPPSHSYLSAIVINFL